MMKKKFIILVALFVVATVTASTFAADIQWFGGAHDRAWANVENWNSNLVPPGPVPTGTDKAKLNFVWANPGPIVSAPGAIANEIFISEDRDLGTVGEQSLTVATGGVLTTNSQVILGYFGADGRAGLPANDGRLIMDGGIANIGTHLFVGFTGNGDLEINGGTLNILNGMFGLGWNTGTASVDISGGELHTEQWNFTNAKSYTFNFSDLRTSLGNGEWVQNHFWKNEIQALVNAGKITTSVPGAHVQVDWDPVLEQTHVFAIPEPFSMALLGLGALCLRRKNS
jgi:hypothetical protein